MSSHLYNSRLGKVVWFVRRFGLSELFLKPLRCIFAPLVIPRLPKCKFNFNGRMLSLFYHAYNMTWVNERAVEIPIIRDYLNHCEKWLKKGINLIGGCCGTGPEHIKYLKENLF